MRRLFTTEEARGRGITMHALRWGERKGRWRRIQVGVYGEGPAEPSRLDVQRARLIARDGVASGALAGVLHGLDSVVLDDRPLRRRELPPERVTTVHGMRCTDGLQTMLDLAPVLDDRTWEQALESALRKGLVTIARLQSAMRSSRIRRVLALRPPGAAPTGSLLEALMIQLIRTVPGVPEPDRQVRVENAHGDFVAFVDLAWTQPGLFIELDGEQHKGQPVYDARRETAVVAATGWLPGRFTWTEVVRLPASTGRRVAALFDQASRLAMAQRAAITPMTSMTMLRPTGARASSPSFT